MVALSCMTLWLGGCSLLAEAVVKALGKPNLHGDLPIPDGGEFAQCMASKPEKIQAIAQVNPAAVPGLKGTIRIPQMLDEAIAGKRPTPAAAAIGGDARENAINAALVVKNPVFGAMTELYGKSSTRGVQPASKTSSSDTVNISQQHFHDFLAQVGKATSTNSWEDLATVSRGMVTVAAANSQDRADIEKVASFADLVAGYMKAYFRGGEFASITVNGARFRSALKNSLQLTKDEEVDQILNAFFPKLFPPDQTGKIPDSDINVFGSIGSVGFVSRGGQSFQFPALQATIDISAARPLKLPKLEYSAVATDLISIIAEASGDEMFGVPAVSNATGVGLGYIKYEQGKMKDAASVTPERFATIESISHGVEAGTVTIVGKVVRGAGFVALNNEAIASAIETFFGAATKKISEKVSWCTMASLNDEKDPNPKPASAAHKTIARQYKLITLSIDNVKPSVE